MISTDPSTPRVGPPAGTGSGFQVAASAAARYEQAAGAFLLGWAGDLVDRAGIRPGERVVDLACGTGFVARLAAARVGDRRRVVGVDCNPAMVAEARRATGLAVVEAPAEATGLAAGAFDVVLCQQGLQYVADPTAVLAEARRILRPGGRLALSLWSDLDRNPFRAAQLAAMAPHLPAGAAAAFRATSVAGLGGTDGLAARLGAVGLEDLAVVEVERLVELPPMADHYPLLVSATPWAGAFAALDARQRRAVVEQVETVAQGTATGCRVPMAVTVATATAPPDPATGVAGAP